MTTKLKDIIYMLNEIGTLASVTLREELAKVEDEKAYMEDPEKLYHHLEFIIAHWRSEHTEIITYHNKMVADSIRWFVINGRWTNLQQIYRALRGDIVEAAENSAKINRVKSDSMMETITGAVQADCDFNNISLKDRRLALKLLEEYKKEHPDENKDND